MKRILAYSALALMVAGSMFGTSAYADKHDDVMQRRDEINAAKANGTYYNGYGVYGGGYARPYAVPYGTPVPYVYSGSSYVRNAPFVYQNSVNRARLERERNLQQKRWWAQHHRN